jgi:hypothetical protein
VYTYIDDITVGHDIPLPMPYTSGCCWFSFLTESSLIVPETMWLAPVSLKKIQCNAHAMSVSWGAFSMTCWCERIRPDSIPRKTQGVMNAAQTRGVPVPFTLRRLAGRGCAGRPLGRPRSDRPFASDTPGQSVNLRPFRTSLFSGGPLFSGPRRVRTRTRSRVAV